MKIPFYVTLTQGQKYLPWWWSWSPPLPCPPRSTSSTSPPITSWTGFDLMPSVMGVISLCYLSPLFLESGTPSHCFCCLEFGQHQSPPLHFLSSSEKQGTSSEKNKFTSSNRLSICWHQTKFIQVGFPLADFQSWIKPTFCEVAKFGEQENLKWVVNRDVPFDRMKTTSLQTLTLTSVRAISVLAHIFLSLNLCIHPF